MEKTIRQQLLTAGMKKNEIDSHASDLYVLKNDISSKWLETYEYKSNVTTFINNIDKVVWYDIPFGNMDEYMESKKGGKQ